MYLIQLKLNFILQSKIVNLFTKTSLAFLTNDIGGCQDFFLQKKSKRSGPLLCKKKQWNLLRRGPIIAFPLRRCCWFLHDLFNRFPKRQADAPEIDFIFYRNNFISLLTKGTIFTCISTLISRVFNKQKYICHTQNWEYRRDIQVQNCTILYTHSKLLQITSELAAQLVLWYGSSEELRDT